MFEPKSHCSHLEISIIPFPQCGTTGGVPELPGGVPELPGGVPELPGGVVGTIFSFLHEFEVLHA